MNKEAILEVKDLKKYFGGIRAVDGIDMKLHHGEIIAIVGDNGAGKSTLIKTITGVYKRTGGEIYIEGKEAIINNTNDARRYNIETVYQSEGVINSLDASSNVFLGRERIKNNFFGRLFKIVDTKYEKNETKKLLERFGIELKDIDADVNDLSGGQRQTVTLGRAVYWGGKIVILDEPTNNLGIKQEGKIFGLIKKLRDEFKVSVIIISHNIDHVFQLVDRIIVLRNGKVIGERIKEKTSKNEIVSMITGCE